MMNKNPFIKSSIAILLATSLATAPITEAFAQSRSPENPVQQFREAGKGISLIALGSYLAIYSVPVAAFFVPAGAFMAVLGVSLVAYGGFKAGMTFENILENLFAPSQTEVVSIQKPRENPRRERVITRVREETHYPQKRRPKNQDATRLSGTTVTVTVTLE